MLGKMSRLASLILVGAMAQTAWAAPHGRVVRVERQRGGPASIPVLCEVKADGSGQCVGPTPRVGDTISVVDDVHLIAEVRITKLQPRSATCDTIWTIQHELARGDLNQTRTSKAIGIIDARLDASTARRMDEDQITSPAVGPDARVALGLDRDGDGSADVIVTQFMCDAAGQPAGSNTGSATGFCIDIWTERDAVMKRAWGMKSQSCQ